MVHGMIRPTAAISGSRVDALIHAYPGRIHLHYADLTDTSSLAALMDKSEPAEVYHLAGQSHIQVSFDLPEYTGETTGLGTLRLLEVMRRRGDNVRFYLTATSELFGEPAESPQTERTPLR